MNQVAEHIRKLFGFRFPRLGNAVFCATIRRLPSEVDTELVPGIRARLNLRDETQRTTYWQGARFEWPLARILNDWIRQGAAHFFDIGSNYGYFSFLLISKNPGLHVHAFEPNPATFRLLNEIKNRNNLKQLQTWNCGLSDAPGLLSLRRGLSDSGHSTFGDHPDLGDTSAPGDSISVLSFEGWREREAIPLPAPGSWIAKIDVEGFEVKVLRGMRQSLEARAFAGLAIEINPFTLKFCGFVPEDVYSFMRDVGYQPMDGNSPARRGPDLVNEYFVPA